MLPMALELTVQLTYWMPWYTSLHAAAWLKQWDDATAPWMG